MEAFARACAARPGYPAAQSNRLFAMLNLEEMPAVIPVSSQCYRPPAEASELAPDAPCAWNGFVTFACSNRLVRVTPRMMEAWGQILAVVPASRLEHVYSGSSATSF